MNSKYGFSTLLATFSTKPLRSLYSIKRAYLYTICQQHLSVLDELAKVKTFKGTRCFKSKYRISAQAIKILNNKSSRKILYSSKEGSSEFMGSEYCLASIFRIR